MKVGSVARGLSIMTSSQQTEETESLESALVSRLCGAMSHSAYAQLDRALYYWLPDATWMLKPHLRREVQQ